MHVWGHMTTIGAKASSAAGAAALMAVLMIATTQGRPMDGGSFLRALTGAVAVLLLVASAVATVLELHRQRERTRHRSIRADIAAHGGLPQRLMV